jgi:tripartite-type tricarboxylate transporter receptor subunit TctC
MTKLFFLLRLSMLLAASCVSGLAHAQDFPSRPVRIIVPVPAGSGLDTMTRLLAQRLSTMWGQPVVVDNQPGANSLIGTGAAARAPADGHTLLVAPDGALTVNPHLYRNMPYDPLKDLAPITQLVTFHQMLLATPSLPVANVTELVRYAKANPGKVSFASFGTGSQPHLLGEMLGLDAGVKLMHVPYRGAPQAVMSTMTGETQLTWSSPFTVADSVRTGKLKALAVAAPNRSPQMPDVPTFAESGLPKVEWTLWFGLFAPAGTPPAVVQRIYTDVGKVLADPQVRDQELHSKGYEASGMDPQAFAALLRREHAERGALVKRAAIKPE